MRRGITLIELLIALAILAVILAPLVVGLANSLKITGNAAISGDVKAAAIRQLEKLTAEIDKIETVNSSSNFKDELLSGSTYYSYRFLDYFYRCPNTATGNGFSLASSVRNGNTSNLRGDSSPSAPGSTQIQCNNGSTGTADTNNSAITNRWSIVGESGSNGEGVITITVTSTHIRGRSITLVNRVSCFDVNTLISDKPVTCSGGARP